MTEDEAKTKWCPFVRFRLTGTEVGVNRDQAERPHAYGEGKVFDCVASDCMAWRWTHMLDLGDRPPREGEGIDANGFIGKGGQPVGHCGLAGAPS